MANFDDRNMRSTFLSHEAKYEHSMVTPVPEEDESDYNRDNSRSADGFMQDHSFEGKNSGFNEDDDASATMSINNTRQSQNMQMNR